MLDVIKNFPEMCEDALEIAKNSSLPIYDFDNIVFCGAGGSVIVGDLVKDLLKYDFEKPIEIFIDYHLPKIANERTLVFVISYSGNPEESLSQFVEAFKRKFKIIVVTSGGKLEEWCRKLNVPMVLVPKGYQSRSALPYLIIPVLVYLQKLGVKNFEEDIEESIEVLKKINTEQLDEISLSLKGAEIAVYAANDFSGVVRRFKNEFNENSKIPVMWHVFPEFDHNEIVGYQNSELNKNRSVIFIRDKNESVEIKTRIEITRKIIEDNVRNVNEIWAIGESKLSKILSLVYMAGYISCKLAELNGIDAGKIEFIDILKKELKERLNLVEKLEKEI